jgi:Bacterial Ig-like domain (group 3)
MAKNNSKHARKGVRASVDSRVGHRFRPALLALEERRLLAMILVNNPTDTPVGGEVDLRQAITTANATAGANTIMFDPMVFGSPQTITLGGTLLALSNTTGLQTITGPAAALTVSGNSASQVFEIDSGVTASISGLTITAGTATGDGGDVYDDGGTLTLTGCTITGGSASYGAGFANLGGTATLTNCTVTGNTASLVAGGVFNTGTTTLYGCTISYNYGAYGGGLASNGLVTLNNCTVTGNSASGNGGGMDNIGTVVFNGCTITYNYSPYGGALSNINYGVATLTNCTISGNSATEYGGAIFSNAYDTNTLTGCTLSNNYAYLGGAMLVEFGTDTLTNCTVSGNSASGGGGLFFFYGYATLNGTTVSGNYATYDGGGISIEFGSGTMTNCTVSGNSAAAGGGMLVDYDVLTMTNCTVGNNYAYGSGGGIYNFSYAGDLTLNNTIVAGNSSDITGAAVAGNNNLIGTGGSAGLVNGMNGNIVGVANPGLAPLGNYGGPTETMALDLGSPAIDAGDNALVTAGDTLDQRGVARIVNGTVDIGSVENQGVTLALVANSTPQSTLIGTQFEYPLAVTLTANDPLDPVSGGTVNYVVNPAGNGAAATLSTNSATVVNGAASVTATANYVAGSYTVDATVGSSSVEFDLTNVGLPNGVALVNTTSDSATPGAGLLSLPEAVLIADNVPGGDVKIAFDPSVFSVSRTIVLKAGQLDLTNTVGSTTITGPTAPLIVSGNNKNREFEVDSGVTVSFNNLTLSNGKVNGAQLGGALYSYGGTVSLTNCTVTGNSAYAGGGIYVNNGYLTLTDSDVHGNTAMDDQGGGVFNLLGTTTLTGCTISGNTGGGVENNFGSATLNGCTLTGNTGGGVFNWYANTTLNDCTLTGNSAQFGAGAFNRYGNLTLNNSTVEGNTASTNGGGVFGHDGSVTLANTTVSGNSAGLSGGGVFTQGGNDTISFSTVSNNTATISGGGLFSQDTSNTLTSSTFSGNATGTGNGGGLFLSASFSNLTNTTLSGNSAGSGGGLFIQSGNATLANTTVSSNTATISGGGLVSTGAYDTLIDTIVAGNKKGTSTSDVGGTDTIFGTNNLIGTGGSGGLVNGKNGNIVGVANPGLAPLGNYGGPTQTMALLPDSPAIDAGTTGPSIPGADQRGVSRLGAVDIGSFESEGFVITVSSGTPQSALNGAVFANPLVVTVTANNPVEPVNGGTVTFTGPATGASATLTSPATIAGTSVSTASATATANSISGTYNVAASATGANSVIFVLTNGADSTKTILTTTASPVVVGQTVTLTATVSVLSPGSGTPAGNVVFMDGTTIIGTVALSGGIATLPLTYTTTGTHSFTAVYAGNTNDIGSTSLASGLTVNPDMTSTALTLSPSTVVVGQTVTLMATVSPVAPGAGTPTGNVVFKDGTTIIGTVALSGGKASLPTSYTSTGTHSFTAVYSGTATDVGSTSTASGLTVNPDSTSTSLTLSPTTVVVGQQVTLTATVSVTAPGVSTPSGSIVFKDGNLVIGTVPLTGNTASLPTSYTSTGSHSFTAVYAGNATETGATSTASALTVNSDSTSTSLTLSPTTAVVGQQITLTATISVTAPGVSTPSGSVTFKDGSTVIANVPLTGNTASLPTSYTSPGSHSFTAVYFGNTTETGSTSLASALTVNPDSTSTALTFNPSTVVVGQQVTMTATISVTAPGVSTPSGTVTFKQGTAILGTVSLTGNTAALKYTFTSPGTEAITAVYSGNANETTSTGSGNLTVSAVGTQTKLTSSASPAVLNQSVTFTATVSEQSPGTATPTGTVMFKDGTTVLATVKLVNGVATFATSSLAQGTHSITAVYSGDANNATSTSAALSESILSATTTGLVSSSPSALIGVAVTFTATIADIAPGTGVPTGTVNLYDGKTLIGTATIVNGVVTFKISTLSKGMHSIYAVYSGDATHQTSTSSTIPESII